MGILRSQVNINDLELIDEQTISGDGVPAMRTKQKGNGSGKIRMSKSATVSPEINLIGKTVDEAIPELDKYLDDAYLALSYVMRSFQRQLSSNHCVRTDSTL